MVRSRLAKLSKWKGVFAASCGKSGFHSKPNHENCGEGTKEVLAHSVEEAEILREQIVDRLKDELQEVWLLHGVGSFDAGLYLRRTPTACGSFEVNRLTCR